MNLQQPTSKLQRSSKPQAPTWFAGKASCSTPGHSNARPPAFCQRLLKFGSWMLMLGIYSLHAAPAAVRLKLGTLAPAGTTYHKSLQAMGEKWRKVSGGAVQLTLFPGGT